MRAVPVLSTLLAAAFVLPGCLGALDRGLDASRDGMLEGPVLRCLPDGACNVRVSNGMDSSSEPSLAINPLDPANLIAGGNDYSQPLIRGSWCGVYRSTDGGATWTHDFIPGYPGDARPSPLAGMDYCGDPVIAFDGQGRAYYAGIAFQRVPRDPVLGVPACTPAGCAPDPYNVQLFVARSDDGGATWPDISIVSVGVSTLRFNDKEWIVVDPETHAVYIVWTIFRFLPTSYATGGFVPDPLGAGEIFFSKSEDAGATWTQPLLISTTPDNQGAVPVVAPDGTIHVVWNEGATDEQPDEDGPPVGRLVHVKSVDKGATFTKPAPVATYTSIPSPLPNTFFRTSTLPGLAVDLSGGAWRGSLYAVWNDWNPDEEHSDVKLAFSRDGGATWSDPVRVNDDATRTDQWMPNVAVDAAGTVHVTWLDRRDDPENVEYHAYAATSSNGGLTFVNARITDAPSDPQVSQGVHPVTGEPRRVNFIGDYLQVVTHGERALSVFPDLREAGPDKPLVNVALAEVSRAPRQSL